MLCLVVPRPPSRPLCAKSCHIFYVCFALSTTISGWHHENLHSLSTSSSLQSMARLGLIYSKCAEIIDFYSLISSVNIHWKNYARSTKCTETITFLKIWFQAVSLNCLDSFNLSPNILWIRLESLSFREVCTQRKWQSIRGTLNVEITIEIVSSVSYTHRLCTFSWWTKPFFLFAATKQCRIE